MGDRLLCIRLCQLGVNILKVVSIINYKGGVSKYKDAIKKAFIKIAEYFKNSVVPKQGKMLMIEAGDTVLVLSQTLLEVENKNESECSMGRRATYVYRNINGNWLCAIDNSYGTTLHNVYHICLASRQI